MIRFLSFVRVWWPIVPYAMLYLLAHRGTGIPVGHRVPEPLELLLNGASILSGLMVGVGLRQFFRSR